VALRDSTTLSPPTLARSVSLVARTPPENSWPSFFRAASTVSHAAGGSMHCFYHRHSRYGAYGSRRQTSRSRARASRSRSTIRDRGHHPLPFGDGASNQAPSARRLNLAARGACRSSSWGQHHSSGQLCAAPPLPCPCAVTDLQRKGRASRPPPLHSLLTGCRLDPHPSSSRRSTRARSTRRPLLVEAVTYRFRGTRWPTPSITDRRRRSPTGAPATRSPGRSREAHRRRLDRRGRAGSGWTPTRSARVYASVGVADASPSSPRPDSLFDDVLRARPAEPKPVLGNETTPERQRRGGRRPIVGHEREYRSTACSLRW